MDLEALANQRIPAILNTRVGEPVKVIIAASSVVEARAIFRRSDIQAQLSVAEFDTGGDETYFIFQETAVTGIAENDTIERTSKSETWRVVGSPATMNPGLIRVQVEPI